MNLVIHNIEQGDLGIYNNYIGRHAIDVAGHRSQTTLLCTVKSNSYRDNTKYKGSQFLYQIGGQYLLDFIEANC